MATLLLRLEGPMQSWGYRSRFKDRDTATEPTKSGVVGLLCAALGRRRSEPLDDLTALRMLVRVDREGILLSDYHTIGGGTWKGRPYGVAKADGSSIDTVLSTRHFLADACFLVALGGDRPLLERLHRALADPVWPLFLGRKSFVPSPPVWLPDGLTDDGAEQAVRRYPFLGRPSDRRDRLRVVSEQPFGQGDPRRDIPRSWADPLDRRFEVRWLATDYIPCPEGGV